MRRLIFPFLLMLAQTAPAFPLDRAALSASIADSDYSPVSLTKAKLGQLLFWDPILSGNRNVACATCHHPKFGTSDGVSLTLGEGGIGLGPDRKPDPDNLPLQRIARNTPALFNLGAREFTALFHDGRVALDQSHPSGFKAPLDENMIVGFASLLAVQSLFPMMSADEMAGHKDENEVSTAVRQGRIAGPDSASEIIAQRVAAIPGYQFYFAQAYPDISAGRPIRFSDISNAIAAFVSYEWRSDTSPFDRFLAGKGILSSQATAGVELFYGAAGCSVCHSGKFQTDHSFHAMGTPQLGPGTADLIARNSRDMGRMGVTRDPADAYAFRTPSLRNITLTAPYGHAGAHTRLPDFLAYHLNPRANITAYTPDAILPEFTPTKSDWALREDMEDWGAIAAAVTTPATTLTEKEQVEILAFLASLEDPIVTRGRLGVPDAVPSGLPVGQ
ncbi:MAG: cytochrome c peroxidase [Paracoccaceae bacterium]